MEQESTANWRLWLGKFGWIAVIVAAVMMVGWSFVDVESAKWVSIGLLVVGLVALGAKAAFKARTTPRA